MNLLWEQNRRTTLSIIFLLKLVTFTFDENEGQTVMMWPFLFPPSSFIRPSLIKSHSMILRSAFLALTLRLPSSVRSFQKFLPPKRLSRLLFTTSRLNGKPFHSPVTTSTMISSSSLASASASLGADDKISSPEMFTSRKDAEEKVMKETLSFTGIRAPSGSLACQHDR